MDQLDLFSGNRELYKLPEHLVKYFPAFLDQEESTGLFSVLKEHTPWTQGQISMYGKIMQTPRLTAWYGDENSTYQFSGSKYNPLPWTVDLSALRRKVQETAGMTFNSVLLNYYRDGRDSVAWHSDNEPELKRSPIIASLSLGQRRTFDIRNKKDHSKKFSIDLENGSLLLMMAELQQQWEHRIAKSVKSMAGRINLTFRLVS